MTMTLSFSVHCHNYMTQTFKAKIGIFMFACIFSTFLPKMAVLGQNRERGGAMLTPMNSFLLLGGCYFCATLG